MKRDDGGYTFDSREDVMQELLEGKESKYLVGFECPKCQRIHVMIFSPRMMVFADPAQFHAPASVELTSEQGEWGVVPDKFCPADGVQMRVLRTPTNEWIFP